MKPYGWLELPLVAVVTPQASVRVVAVTAPLPSVKARIEPSRSVVDLDAGAAHGIGEAIAPDVRATPSSTVTGSPAAGSGT